MTQENELTHPPETTASEPAEYSLQSAEGVGPSPTEAERWKYHCLNQLVINAKMRLDMYSAEAARAKRDLLSAQADLTAHVKDMSSRYGDISPASFGDPNGR